MEHVSPERQVAAVTGHAHDDSTAQSEHASAAPSRIAGRIKQFRQQRGWSTRELAEECSRVGDNSLTRSTIAKIESGVRKTVTADEIAVLAQALGVTPNDLVEAAEVANASPIGSLRAGLSRSTPEVQRSWDRLIANLRSGECIPIIGAGASADYVQLGAPIAMAWGEAAGYPLKDKANLPSVMQYIAIENYNGDSVGLKRDFAVRELASMAPPDFEDPAQVHGMLAKFDIPLYVTTNYDDFMYLALQFNGKQPRRDHSRWYDSEFMSAGDDSLADRGYEPSGSEPLVFHLHGRYQVPESLVLTEDDNIEYLVQLATDRARYAGEPSRILPAYVRGLLRSQPLLFIGYSLRDQAFLTLIRLLMHGIPTTHRRNHYSVQLPPVGHASRPAREYLERYFGLQRIQILWNSSTEFAMELDNRLAGTSRSSRALR